MASKKAAVSTLVGQYDIELMTENELRLYVKALQEEHARMRKARNLYQKDKSELLNFLNSIQDDMAHNKKVNMIKNIEQQEQNLQLENKLKFEEELIRAKKIENIHQAERDTFESYINLITTEIRNKEEEYELLKTIIEKDREIEHLEYTCKLITIQSKDNYFSEYQERSEMFKKPFQNLVEEYHAHFLESLEEFSENKIKSLQAIWGEIPTAENNEFSAEIAKMAAYFKDIYWKNIKTIENLHRVLTELKKELNNITLNLRDVRKENDDMSFKNILYSPRQSLITDQTFSLRKQRKLEELTYENYLLHIKLEMLNKEYLYLKRNFISAFRRIHQTADFKSLLSETKLSALHNKFPQNFSF